MVCLVLHGWVCSLGRGYKTHYVTEGSYDTVSRCACWSGPLFSTRQHLLSLATLESRTVSNASKVVRTGQLTIATAD